MAQRTTRFSGADWADQLRTIILVGVGGIGSWTAINLARIGHTLHIVDPDIVDETNVNGGQAFRNADIGTRKVLAVSALCRTFGTINPIYTHILEYKRTVGTTNIMITGLDNMAARKEVYEGWKTLVESKKTIEEKAKCLLIDGRLTLEMHEVISIQGNKPEQMALYEKEYLFDDSETVDLDCSTKQSTFGAMGIASIITATLCNFLTNEKLQMEFREVPFYQRAFFPVFQYNRKEPEILAEAPINEAKIEEGSSLPVIDHQLNP